jgi:hypothetical protein
VSVRLYFEQLGERVDRAWQAANYSHAAFPRLCAEALTAAAPASSVDLDRLFTDVFTGPRLPTQADLESEFGEPPLTLYWNERFHVTIDFWIDGTTAIHDHSFSGAFHVLAGGSIHTLFDFEPTETINEHLLVGRLKERQVERLRTGDTRVIEGGKTIHSLFHLDRPSATIVIRTWRDPGAAPQFNYERGGLAWDTLYDRTQIKRRCDLIRLLSQTRPDQVARYGCEWLSSADFVTKVAGLSFCMHHLSPEEGDGLLDRLAPTEPRLVELVTPLVREFRREAAIVRKRQAVTDPELRLFLAVLLNVHGREAALRFIREEFPARDPVEAVMQWCHALQKQSPTPAPAPASPLGFDMDDVVAATFAGVLHGEGDEGVARRVAAIAKRPLGEPERTQLRELSQALRHSDMFRTLLC